MTEEQKQKKAANDKARREAAKAVKQVENEVVAEATTEPQPVDLATYNQYTSLKFLEIELHNSGQDRQLTDENKKRLIELENILKSCSGSRPVRTVTAAIKNEVIKLVEGIPVPAEIRKIAEEHVAYYFNE